MNASLITLAVGIVCTLCGFLAGRKSVSTFSVENKATDYAVDIDVHPTKRMLVIKRIIPKSSKPTE